MPRHPKPAGEVGFHEYGPSIECSTSPDWPGLNDSYNALWASPQHLDRAMTGSFCPDAMPHERQAREPPSCHAQLFHGRLNSTCLAARNLSAQQLPCVRTLLVTAFPGSGTPSMAMRLKYALRRTHTTLHEGHSVEPDVLVSWLTRTDV